MYLRFPSSQSKQTLSWFTLGAPFFRKQTNLSLLLGTQIGATRTSAFPSPQNKQTSLGLLWRPHFFANRHSLSLLLGTRCVAAVYRTGEALQFRGRHVVPTERIGNWGAALLLFRGRRGG